jgi:hypothetical protein
MMSSCLKRGNVGLVAMMSAFGLSSPDCPCVGLAPMSFSKPFKRDFFFDFSCLFLPHAIMTGLVLHAHRTFFDKSEIKNFYLKFEEMGGSLYDPVKPLPKEVIVGMPVLVNNPLRERIAEVFCSSRDIDTDPVQWSFDDYLQFHNAFSSRSSLIGAYINAQQLVDLKIYWAFRIFGTHRHRPRSVDCAYGCCSIREISM